MKQCEEAKDYTQQASWDRTLDVTGNGNALLLLLRLGTLPFTGP